MLDAAAKVDYTAHVEFVGDTPSDKGTLGTVRSEQRGHGIVRVRHAARLAGNAVTVQVSEPRGRRAVSVGDIRW